MTGQADPRRPRGGLTRGGLYASGTAEQTKNVTYRYDTHAVAPAGTSYPKGRLTDVAVENGTVVRYDQIDAEGRIRKHTQITDNVPYAFTYTYNAAGGLESMVYPGGRTVFTCYDAAGRVQSVRKDSATAADVYAQVQAGTNLTTNAWTEGYHPMGGMERLALESGKLTRGWSYNGRGQALAAGVWSTPPGQPVSARMLLTLGYGTDTANNGNVRTQDIAVGGTLWTAAQIYTYDAMNRLKTSVETNPANATNWKQGFGYDRWGNRWVEEANTSGIAVAPGTPNGQAWFNQNNNRMTGAQPDGAG